METTTRYDGALMVSDMTGRRMDLLSLVSRAKYQVSKTTARAFLNNGRQTERTATILAEALGQPLERYVRVAAISADPNFNGGIGDPMLAGSTPYPHTSGER